MNVAKTSFRIFNSEDTIDFNGHGGAFTNRGQATVVLAGNIELAPKESFSIPVIDPKTVYQQSFQVSFLGSGTKKLVLQEITIRVDSCAE